MSRRGPEDGLTRDHGQHIAGERGPQRTRQVPALGRRATAGDRDNAGNCSEQVPLAGGPSRAEGDWPLGPSLRPVQGGSACDMPWAPARSDWTPTYLKTGSGTALLKGTGLNDPLSHTFPVRSPRALPILTGPPQTLILTWEAAGVAWPPLPAAVMTEQK